METQEMVNQLNVIQLSEDKEFLECWNNGTRVYTVHIGGQLKDAVSRAQEWFRKWSGGAARLSKIVAALLAHEAA